MKYAIQNNSGQWWTGTCWGVKQAREEYHADDLPGEIDGLELADLGDVTDILYLDESGEVEAGVRSV